MGRHTAVQQVSPWDTVLGWLNTFIEWATEAWELRASKHVIKPGRLRVVSAMTWPGADEAWAGTLRSMNENPSVGEEARA